MNNYILYGFVILLLTQAVKLGDFVLLQSQKDQIQRFMEKITEKLNNIKPFQVISFLKTGSGTAILIIPLIVFLAIVVWNLSSDIITARSRNWNWSILFIVDTLIFTVVFTYTVLMLIRGIYKGWRSHLDAMLEEERFSSFILVFGRLLGLFLVGILPMIIWIIINTYWHLFTLSTTIEIIIFIIVVLVPSMLAFYLLASVLSGTIALLIWIMARIGYTCIWIIRLICDRIVRYQKGAWQAIILLLTIILGILGGYLELFGK